MQGLFYVALGGAIGASARHLVGIGAKSWFGTGFPYGTFIVNVLGSFLMGLLIGWLALKISGHENLKLFLATGLLGGFTTFSAFSLDAIQLFEKKDYAAFAGYVGGSVILSLLALFLGLIIMRKLGAA